MTELKKFRKLRRIFRLMLQNGNNKAYQRYNKLTQIPLWNNLTADTTNDGEGNRRYCETSRYIQEHFTP
jgi:hypothetical protein